MISRSGIYSLRALATLAGLEGGAYAGAATVAERLGAPANYLGKLLQTLVRGGILDSQKGAGGGFRLARHAQRIRLIDVLELVEDVDRWQGCCLGSPDCSDDNPCPLHEQWAPLRDRYLELLTDNTIADLQQEPRRADLGASQETRT